MCGIAGVLGFDKGSFRVSEPQLNRMRDSLSRRGPDGAGSWISPDQRVGLGHRRLSIIDLSEKASQPMGVESGRLQLVFNGEIYNHAALRKELEAKGKYRWKTDHSDTEVILHAFEEWGIGCLERLRGMFAIGLWDAQKRELWLVRDRVGEKPLYYSLMGDRIVFASEIKALLEDPGLERAVDEEAFFHYLSFGVTPAPLTLFKGVKKLPAGSWLKVGADGAVEENRYWDVWDHTQPLKDVSEEEIGRRVLDELRTSVEMRKVSDVPVGVFLSGGVDSSTNTALFSEGEGKGVKTFCIGYEGEHPSYKNENGYARMMAEKAGAEYHERLLKEEDLFEFLPRMARMMDEPLADPACFPVFYVSKLARDNGVVVCQVGEGADELFCGYRIWKKFLELQALDRWPVPRIAKKAGLGLLRLLGLGRTPAAERLRRAAEGQPIFWCGSELISEAQKARLLSPRLREKFKGRTSWEVIEPIRRRFEQKAWEKSDLHWMTYADLNLKLPELFLMRVDKMSMDVALECRVPFLDHKFVELALSIPQSVIFKDGVYKSILKKAVRGLIPDELIDRRKQGFGVPLYEWFFGKFGQRARADLEDFCRKTDFLDPKEAVRVLEEDKGPRAWLLLNFAYWWKEFLQ